MNILILGGHGFIGSHTAHELKKLGHTVAIVDMHHRYGEYPRWEYEPVLQQRIEYIGAHREYIGDVTDACFLENVFKKENPDRVIDLATYPNAKMVKKNVVDATNNMISATAIALDLCVKYNVERFTLASSSMVYGDFDTIGGKPSESAQCNPLTLYGSYKLQCERMCRIWHKEYGLEYSLLRPSALYGTRDMVVRVISKLAISAFKNGEMLVQGATNKLDFSWVEDVAKAFVEATLHPDAANEIFNCTRGNGRTIIDAAEIIQKRIPAKILTKPHDDFYPNRDTLNSSKLMEYTGWKPEVDIEQGIPKYLGWFLNQEFINNF
jgi:nucleoside-diphosphate-sugar epimerase